jgi:hypothetical protein
MSEPIHRLLSDLALWSPRFMNDSRARRYWIDLVSPFLADVHILASVLEGPQDWNAAREIAASALYAAELEGNLQAQKTFLTAIKHLSPLTSPQRDWAVSRLASVSDSRVLKH